MGQTKWRREGKNISSAKLSKKKSFVSFFVKVFLSKCVKNKKVEKKLHMFSWIILKKLICFFMVEIEWKLISRIFFFLVWNWEKKFLPGEKVKPSLKKKKKKNGLMCETELNLLNLYFFCMKLGEKKVFSREKNIFFLKNFLYDMWKIISKKQFFFSWRKQVKI